MARARLGMLGLDSVWEGGLRRGAKGFGMVVSGKLWSLLCGEGMAS